MAGTSNYQRLSVNINEEAAEILRQVTTERGISTTEAIRRAIGLLGFFEDAKRTNAQVFTENVSGDRRAVTII